MYNNYTPAAPAAFPSQQMQPMAAQPAVGGDTALPHQGFGWGVGILSLSFSLSLSLSLSLFLSLSVFLSDFLHFSYI